MVFLSAHWSHLILINYALRPDLLLPFCPEGTEPDVREGKAFASLVAFDFLETRVLGIPWPGYTDFSEINLRFYVRHGRERGVSFISELVPLRFVAAMARWTYNEPYEYRPMRSTLLRNHGEIRVIHHVDDRSGRQEIAVLAEDQPHRPEPDSWAHFFKEHQWGFGRNHFGRTIRYEVRHPHWDVFPVKKWRLRWDFAAFYGSQWSFLQEQSPHSVILAKGSPVTVMVKGRL